MTITNIEVQIQYDTTRAKSEPSAYRVSLGESDGIPHPLRQIGPVWNNVVYYRGVYATRKEAAQAARRFRKP